jgi:hypothetical protein
MVKLLLWSLSSWSFAALRSFRLLWLIRFLRLVLVLGLVIILRLFVILPIAYELICFVLKVQAARGRVLLPLWSFPLLTMKPPMTFAFFVFIAFLVKIREYRYCRHGKTHEEYLEFMKTNRNSFQMSVRLCFSMIAFAVIDAILFFLLVYGHAATVLPAADAVVSTGETLTEAETAALNAGVSVAQAVGIGKSIMLAAVAPLMLLYSYTSEPKRKIVSTLIPVGGILVIVLIILEAIRLGAGLIVGENKIDLVAIRQWLKQITAQ